MAIRALDVTVPNALPRERGWGGALWLFVRKNPLGATGGLLMLLLILAAVLAGTLATHNPIRTSTRVLVAPGAEFWLGTDNLGRDLWSRVVYGARISLLVGVASTLLGAVTGGLIGLVSGYVGGKTDLIAQRLMDIMQALPILVLALVMAAALGPSLINTIIAISVVIAPRAARVVRASVLAIREFAFIEAASALGVSHSRVAFVHILPNTFGPFVVLVTAQLGGAILAAAFVPRTRHSGALPVLGADALDRRRRVCPEGAVARGLSRTCDQFGRLRHESSGRRAPRHAGPAAPRLLTLAARQPFRKSRGE
jgi:peptide/nickel transport system permease protein